MDNRRRHRKKRKLHDAIVMTRLAAAAVITIIAFTYQYHGVRAFCGNAILNGDGGLSIHNNCLLQLQSSMSNNSNDSTSSSSSSSSSSEQEERTKARIDRIRRRRQLNLEHWGVELQHEQNHQHQHQNLIASLSSPAFPSTFGEVADEACRAIAGTLSGLQRPDPNVASNAMHTSVLDYRPTQPHAASKRRWVDGDDENKSTTKKKNGKEIPARMGIEIDGAAYLADRSNDEGRAMRILSLQIAQRLCTSSWDDDGDGSGNGGNGNSKNSKLRSVAVYFNSMEQSLLASRELSRWKDEEAQNNNSDDCNSLDRILIHCLGQDSLPPSMVKKKVMNPSAQQKKRQNQELGERFILIVKPTDYDTDSLIPIHNVDSHTASASNNQHQQQQQQQQQHQPTIQANVVDKLQSLLFQASASSIPAVVLSPRLSELPPLQSMMAETYKRTGPNGFEQSGFQNSATYGGIEPPVGPTSWLLRDLVPPIYVWAGCGYAIGRRKRSHRSIEALFRQQQYDAKLMHEEETTSTNTHHHHAPGVGGDEYTYYSRVALTQSTMEAGHFWHMFAVKERIKLPMSRPSAAASASSRSKANNTLERRMERGVSYHYIGSSHASRGRPSSRIMNDVFEEFCEMSRGE